MKVIKSFHGKEIKVTPGLTVLHYENGFLQDGITFTTAESAKAYQYDMRIDARRFLATSHTYSISN